MDRYDFPYRPDMRPGLRDRGTNDYTDLHHRRVPWEIRIAVAMFVVAILVSFGLGEKVSALAERTGAAVACQEASTH